MQQTTVAGINALYTPGDVERFLQAAGEIAIESFRFHTSGNGSVTGSLTIKKLASHKRLVIPSVQVCREGSNWVVTTDPLFNPVWATGGQSLATALLAILQATEEMQLVMPREFTLVTMAESLFESVRAFADLLVCRLPKRDAFPKNLSSFQPHERTLRWHSSIWQMRLPRNTLPVTVNNVLGYAAPADVFALYRSVAYIPSSEPTVVEIGSFTGLSTCIFSHSLRRHGLGGKVYCVDLWDTYAERNPSAQETGFFAYKSGQLRQLFDHYISTAGATQVTPICEDSTRAWQNFADGSIDLLFIDGDHSYEGCLADLSHWYPKVKPDGVILGHDYDWDTVRAAAQDFSRQHGFRLQEMEGGAMFLLLMPQASAHPRRELIPLELVVASCV
jgi:predicted O-methyltransferase YrrM